MVEYNGMWKVSDFEGLRSSRGGWAIEQKLTTVDASTFQMYLTNLKAALSWRWSETRSLCCLNRCEDIKPLAGYRRSVKSGEPPGGGDLREMRTARWKISLRTMCPMT